jgi:hypothetical protein
VKNPCGECPFRKKSLRGYIGGHEDVIEIFDLVSHDQKFPCHVETNEILEQLELDVDDDDSLAPTHEQLFQQAVSEAPFCTGALIFMNQTCKRSRDPSVRKLQDEAGTNAAVFSSPVDFLTHHRSKEYAKRIGRLPDNGGGTPKRKQRKTR